jgi:MFS family permease
MAIATENDPHGKTQIKKAAASGWIGSALEYYDFFAYANAAALVFPQIFFPSGDPKVAIAASLATFGVGYVARPLGAFVLGHWGDTRGRKHVLLVCMFLMGFATLAVGLLPTYQQVGWIAPALLVFLRLIQGFAVAGEVVGASSMILEHAPFGRRGYYTCFALQGVQAGQIMGAAVFLPLASFLSEEAFISWGWRIPFLLSFVVIIAGFIIRREVDETPAFTEETKKQQLPKAPILEAFKNHWADMLRVTCISLVSIISFMTTIFAAAYAVQPGYGINFPREVYLWIPVLGNLLAVLIIPFAANLSDRVGRRPLLIWGAIQSGSLSFFYLYAISIRNVPLAIGLALVMWGVFFQGYQAIFSTFYAELFPTRTRVTAMGIGHNLSVTIIALIPSLFAELAPPGSTNVPLVIGSITFVLTLISAVAAWSARETYRLRMHDLGDPNAVPMDKHEYDTLRKQTIAAAKA